jgi:hypothetical protein
LEEKYVPKSLVLKASHKSSKNKSKKNLSTFGFAKTLRIFAAGN